MKIFLGADHAGFELKETIKIWLKSEGHEVADEGAFKLNPDDDYPDFIEIVAKQVASDPENHRGLIFGGSGQGEAMCANRFKHVRAAVWYGGSDEILKLSRGHNNANILSIGARFVDEIAAKRAIKLWLDTTFSGEDRHIRRIAKLDYHLRPELEF
ncbi:MAG: RpiB/LacA/LacB family sugar-phosphate isomerase [Candidatus Vogelbacteria bacterium]|nr:RpiB/LacA/LacB family sugar-phosphate isomerase [Candidatus Vogelbacteria bacterium]